MKTSSSVNIGKIRIPLVVLSVIIPVIFFANFYATKTVSNKITQEAKNNFILHGNLLADTIQEWNKINVLALINLSNQTNIVNPNYHKQKIILAEIVKTYKHLYLAHIMNLKGWDIARSDEEQLKYYGDRNYFTEAVAGKKISYQTVISRTTKQPSLCLATPTFGLNKTIEGVTSICTDLKALTKQIGQLRFGETGYAFVIDQNATLLAHPDPKILSENRLMSWSEYPPVKNRLQGNDKIFSFTDKNNVQWISYSTSLNNGWILVIQQQEAEFMAYNMQFKTLAFLIILVLIIIISVLIVWITNYLIASLNNTTKVTTAINHNELERKTTSNNQNELEFLANSFNQSKREIQDIFTSLEQLVEPKKAQSKKNRDDKNIMMK